MISQPATKFGMMIIHSKRFLIGLILLFSAVTLKAQIDLEKMMYHPWVDSVYNSLSPERKIGQLIWIDVTAKNNPAKQLRDAELIKKYGFGGIIYFEGDPVTQANLTNFYQSMSITPLLVVMDAEWGIAMRLPGIIPFPYNMSMGAMRDTALIKKATAEMARQMKRIGIHISLGPACDINTEPMNPIIGMRSFGESRELATESSLAYVHGLQQNGIMATAKHYPGHGDTKTDSHLILPVLPYSRQRLDSLELYPFHSLANAGVGCIMTAHLHVPAIDPTNEIPSSLSPMIIDQILHHDWNFKGLVITDAMNMKGVNGFENPGKLEVLALKAGNDVVEYPSDPELTILAVQQALLKKELSWEDINIKCRKVLAAKLWCGLNNRQRIDTNNLLEEINTPRTEWVKRQLIGSSLTLLENSGNLMPLKRLDTLRIASLSVGTSIVTPFQKMLAKYTKIDDFHLKNDFTTKDLQLIQKQLESYNLVITGIHSMYESKLRHSLQVGILQNEKPQHPYGASEELDELLNFLAGKKKAITVFFANPYGLGELKASLKTDGLIMAYQNDSLVQEMAAQLIFGGIGAKGKLPVTIKGKYSFGEGLVIDNPVRLKYTIPEEVGMSSERLNRQIDSLVNRALEKKAFPGCNVLVAKEGKVIFRKAYGYHTYNKYISEKEEDLYDLASVSKISGGLPMWLKLYDEGKINLDGKVSDYFPVWRNHFLSPSNKADITVRELLSHQSGLTPFIPFWKKSLVNGKITSRWYQLETDEKHTLQVAKGLWLDNRFVDNLNKQIKKSPLKSRGKYVYSDLPFVITPQIISKVAKESFTTILDQYFYKPLGAYTTTYNPLQKFTEERIIPTENDNYYRRQQLCGTVHDESSAVLGGISGNAGLFSNANDLAKLLQMYLQEGTYGGERYLSENTLREFTKVQFPQNNNRRGLGFDKPLLNNLQVTEKEAYPIKAATPESFGHSGYTGTFVWIDPVYGLVYIFLSNRVYPTRENNTISEINVRTDIQKIIYENMIKK